MTAVLAAMTGTEAALWVLLACAGLLGSAMCSGMETGFYALNRVRLAVRAATPTDARARALRAEVDHPDRVLATLLIANNLFNYFGVLGLTTLLAARGLGETTLIVLNALLVTPILLVLGESLPKEVFRTTADRVMPAILPLLRLMRWAFTLVGVLPVVLLFGRTASRLTGADREAAFARDGRARMAALLKEGAGHGVLSESQSSLLDRALDLRGAHVMDEMTPWRRVRAIPADATRIAALRRFAASGHGRAPLVAPDGSVVGVLRHIDLHLHPQRTPADLAQPPVLIEPHTSVRDALRIMSTRHARLAIVARRGRPMGLITAADLVEPLTGRLPL